MPKTPLIGLLTLSLLATGISARAQDAKSANTGAVLLDRCGEVVKSADSPSYNADTNKAFWCLGYVSGITNLISDLRLVESTNLADFLSNKRIGSIDVCFPHNDVSGEQDVRIVVKWLREHPEDLHQGAKTLVVAALHNAFPCAEAAH